MFWFNIEPCELDSYLLSQLLNGDHDRLMIPNESFEIDFYLLSKLPIGYHNRLSSYVTQLRIYNLLFPKCNSYILIFLLCNTKCPRSSTSDQRPRKNTQIVSLGTGFALSGKRFQQRLTLFGGLNSEPSVASSKVIVPKCFNSR